MIKPHILLSLSIVLVLLSSPLVVAACTCAFGSPSYYAGTTVNVLCSCSAVAEKNKPYIIQWYNTTRVNIENDTGTTPNAVDTVFSGSLDIPSYARNGIWNVSLFVGGTFSTYKEFNVTNSSVVDVLYFGDIEYTENITLGKKASLFAELESSEGYIYNAKCIANVISPYGNIVDEKETLTSGGDGHLRFIFETTKWSAVQKDIVGLNGYIYVECNCIPNCTKVTDAPGCCLGSTNYNILGTKYMDRYLPITFVADETPLDSMGNFTIAVHFLGIIVIFFLLSLTWNFQIFSSRNAQDKAQNPTNQGEKETANSKQNIIRVLFMIMCLWFITLLLSLINTILDFANAGTNLVKTFETIYQVDIWVNYVVSAFLFIFFIYNLSLYLINVFGRGKK